MRNVLTELNIVDGENMLTIRVNLDAPTEKSSSGKSDVIATTSGNITIDGTDDVKMGLNIYRKAQ